MSRSINPVINIIDAAFDLSSLSNCRLIMRCSEHSITLLIGNSSTKKFLFFEHYTLEDTNLPDTIKLLQSLTEKYPWLTKNNLESTSVIVVNQKATFIPYALFYEDEKQKYLSFNVDIEREEEVLTEKMNTLKSYCVFAIPGQLHYALLKHLKEPSIHHYASALTESLSKHLIETGTKERTLHISFQRNIFFVHLYKGSELQFYNVFSFESPDEFIFYLLNVTGQLKINHAKTPLFLTGDIDPNIELYKQLKKHFSKISHIDIPYYYSFPPEFKELPFHVYHVLFSMA